MSRGRKRGSGQQAPNLEGLGMAPGEKLPPPILQPPPLFPPLGLEKKPLKLDPTRTQHYQDLVLTKASLRAAMQDSVFYLRKTEGGKAFNITRYSDRYKTLTKNDFKDILDLVPNWSKRLPKELQLKTKKIKKSRSLPCNKEAMGGPHTHSNTLKDQSEAPLIFDDHLTPSLGAAVTIGTDIMSMALSVQEAEAVKEETTAAVGEEGEEEEEEIYDEEEEEEQGDYQLSYFDPGGDDFVGDDDDDDGQDYY